MIQDAKPKLELVVIDNNPDTLAATAASTAETKETDGADESL